MQFNSGRSKPIQDAVRNFGRKIKKEEKDLKNKLTARYKEKTMGKVGFNISTYTIRHRFASDLKISDISDDDISAALGHQSADTKSTYGSTTLGINKNSLVSVLATTPIRQSKKTNNLSFIQKSISSYSLRI